MSQKHPLRDRDRASKQRREKAAADKKAKKALRLKLRAARDEATK
jgi:hypothetical protein